jgi:endonuclease/exonuclease/phosphatase family metal-dependent hydrolase
MAPAIPSRLLRRAALVAAAAALGLAPRPANALRIVDYNLHDYPQTTNAVTKNGVRHPMYRTILAPLDPDIVVVQEMGSQTGVSDFKAGVLDSLFLGTWTAAPFINGNDTDNALFYKSAKATLLDTMSFYPYPTAPVRLVMRYHFRLAGYTSAGAEFWIYSQHLKASTGSANQTQRLNEAIGIRDNMNTLPAGAQAILCGDFNIYSGSEPAFLKFKESQADNDGRLYDPLNAPAGIWNDGALSAIHTQSPCATCPSGSGFSNGGMDDRFDMFLATYPLADGEAIELLPSTYKPIGNDGLHYNLNINDAPVIPEGAAYANALWGASDHLPIRVDLSVPARIGVSTSPIAFGTVIVGATASVTRSVANNTAAPADTLEYSYTVPAGFTAPAGTIALLAGTNSLDPIGMSTAAAGVQSGSLLVNSNDLAFPTRTIALSGTVLEHAAVSLRPDATVLEDTLDFGDHAGGSFAAQLASIYNRGYDALHARLSVNAAAFAGTDAARFSIPGGFTPALVEATAAAYSVAFDDAGAPSDSTYRADLTFASADQALPGATAQPAVVLHLRARVTSGTVSAPGAAIPSVTRLYSPIPNPMRGGGAVRFDLARAGRVQVEVFDLSGRRVASLADGEFPAGTHALVWNARHDDGRAAGAGLFFVRLSGPGLRTQTVRAALIR